MKRRPSATCVSRLPCRVAGGANSAVPAAGRRWRLAWLLLLPIVLEPACGRQGLPSPPEPRGPLPPQAVIARQVGQRIEVRFGVPQARSSRPAQQPLRAELIRVAYPPDTEVPEDPGAFRRRGELVQVMEADPLPSRQRVMFEDSKIDVLRGWGVGWTIRYGVRVRDRRGRPSPLVVARDLQPLDAVNAPIDLAAEPTAGGVRLEWRPPSGSQDLTYNIYRAAMGAEPPENPINSTPVGGTEFFDTTVQTGNRYVYSVRVVLDPSLPPRESDSCIPREVLAQDRFAPAAPRGLVAVQEGTSVRLFWDPNPERDLAGYRVFRRLFNRGWTRVGPDPVEQPTWVDTDVRTGQRLSYRVAAVDRVQPPNESPPSEIFELEVLTEPTPGGLP